MPVSAARQVFRRYIPEMLVALLAATAFFGCLGSLDLWGKREQRASAEALDTVREGNWLIAKIQARPRLEKPPLPRWTIAALMTITGREDEFIVRLPSALSALGMTVLVYSLGRRLGGRSVGLASSMILVSSIFFVIELRQAGNDGPLAFFTTLAMYAAWRRIEADDANPRARRWILCFFAALGLGFLTKGPIILILVAIGIAPFFMMPGMDRSRLRFFLDARGGLIFLFLALCWPVPVLLRDPNAWEIWRLEMAQKTGTAGIHHSRARDLLIVEWPGTTVPWFMLGISAMLTPFLRRGKSLLPNLWFPWWWAVGNLVMFCFWKVAKPNYYIPCIPGAALLAGMEWVRLARAARDATHPESAISRYFLQAHWWLFGAGAAIAPIVVYWLSPPDLAWGLLGGLLLGAGSFLAMGAWRRGGEASALLPLAASIVGLVLIGYGGVAPRRNLEHGHRGFAETLEEILPAEIKTVLFFRELDEGLWFYLKDRKLEPVPGSRPNYNKGFDLVKDYENNRLIWDRELRVEEEKQRFVDWLRAGTYESPYLLMRGKIYDLFASDIRDYVTPLYRERGMERNELILVKINRTAMTAVSGKPAADTTTR